MYYLPLYIKFTLKKNSSNHFARCVHGLDRLVSMLRHMRPEYEIARRQKAFQNLQTGL